MGFPTGLTLVTHGAVSRRVTIDRKVMNGATVSPLVLKAASSLEEVGPEADAAACRAAAWMPIAAVPS